LSVRRGIDSSKAVQATMRKERMFVARNGKRGLALRTSMKYSAQRGAEPRIRDLGGACPTRRELLWGCPVRLVHSPQSAGHASRSLIVIGLHLRDRPKNPFGLQAQIRCQLQENSSRENHLLAIHTDQPAKPEYMSRARMRVKHHKIAAAPPIKFFSC
jgi:hypothetical protein